MSVTRESLIPLDLLGETYVIGVVKGLQSASELMLKEGLHLDENQRQIVADRFRLAMFDIGLGAAEMAIGYVEGLIADYEDAT